MMRMTWKYGLALFILAGGSLVSIGAEEGTNDTSRTILDYHRLPSLIAEEMVRDAGDRFPGNFGMPILNGADAIRAELDDFEEPLPNPQWPAPMARDAIYFGGTDCGRFIPESLTLNDDVRPDVLVIAQNALADETYAEVLRRRLLGKCWFPASEDTARAFETFVKEVQSGERRPGGDVKIENGRVQVTGALAVMQINEIISKDIFDHNKAEHDFYLEESYLIPWMYDYLSPHGFMMKLNAEKTDKLRADECREDWDFWDWQTRRLLDDPQFRRRRAEQWRILKGGNGGFGDDEDVYHRVACRAFAKLRCSIAGLYARKGRMKEALVAFREAYMIDPQSPEATFRYVQELLFRSGQWNAIFDLIEYTVRINPENRRNEERTRSFRKPVRAMRDAKATMNALLKKYGTRCEKYWGQDTFSPETLKAFSSDDLGRLADASLDYCEANLQFCNIQMAWQSAFWLQGNPAHTNTFERAWRSAKVFKQLQFGSNEDFRRNAVANVLAALTFPEANTFAVQNEAAIILAQAERKDECIVAINKAMKFPESRDFATLVQYAKILERFGQKREAVKVINRALPLVQNAQPSNVVEAAKLMLALNHEKYTPDVQSLLRPLLRRPNVSWTAESLVDFALVSHDVQMPQEACEALEKARRMNPVLIENLLKSRPELKELLPGQVGK